MNYEGEYGGRVEGEASSYGRVYSFQEVQERLVDALLCWRRMPDRERGWQWIKAYWPEMRRHNHFGDYADTEAVPRPLPLSREQIAEMEEASEWMRFVPERDRQLVALALLQLARGVKQISWKAIRRAMNADVGTRGLGMRYSRALTAIARALSKTEVARKGAEIRAD